MKGTWRAHAAMLLFAALISTTFSVGSLFANDLDPGVLTFLRFLIAGILFSVLLAALGRWRLPGRREAIQALLLGFCVGTFFVTSFICLRATGATEVGVITSSIPVMTAAIAYLTLGQRVGGRLIGALLVAASGVVYVLVRGSLGRLLELDFGPAELVLLFGCLVYACYSPIIRGLDQGSPGLLVSYWTVMAGLLVIGVYASPEIAATAWTKVPLRAYAGITYLAVFTTILSVTLMQYASMRLPQAKVLAYAYMVPVFTLAGELAITARLPDTPVLIGVAVIAVAMFVLQTSPSTPAIPPVATAPAEPLPHDRR